MLKLIICRSNVVPTTKFNHLCSFSPIFLSFFTSTYQQKNFFFHHKIVFVHTTNPCLSWKKRTKKIYFLLYGRYCGGVEPALLIFFILKIVNTFFLSNFVCNGTYTLGSKTHALPTEHTSDLPFTANPGSQKTTKRIVVPVDITRI